MTGKTDNSSEYFVRFIKSTSSSICLFEWIQSNNITILDDIGPAADLKVVEERSPAVACFVFGLERAGSLVQ